MMKTSIGKSPTSEALHALQSSDKSRFSTLKFIPERLEAHANPVIKTEFNYGYRLEGVASLKVRAR
jgi:hypothetical protein